ncbi:arginine--tRNA ligase [Nanoarchaeota archaeon]
MNKFKYHIFEKIVDEVGSDDIDDSILEVPPDPELGDYAFPCFVLSKKLKKSPQAIAEFLATKIKPDEFIQEVKPTGPYLNFFINKSKFAESTIRTILEKKVDYGRGSGSRTVMIESPGPNTNKPLHLGHVRNMLLGNGVGSILRFNGNKVINVNINNDRGVHICKSMLAYMLWGKNEEPDMKSDHFVGKWYVKYAQELKNNPDLDNQIRDVLKKWEAGDKETLTLWKKMNTWAFNGFKQTYAKFDMVHDKEYYESEHYNSGKQFALDGLKSGALQKDEDGNIIADMEEKNLGKKVILRADGTSVYITQDMALANIRFNDFPDADQLVYVVGSEQNHQFKQIFEVFRILGFPFANKCYHLSYGMVNLPDGKMKSREGTVVDADDIVDEVQSLAKAAIELRHKDLNDEEILNRASVIGMAALRFFILKQDPGKDMTYDPKASISFEGETGPYVQYVHARVQAIKKKYNKPIDTDIDFSLLKTPEELLLIKLLEAWPATAHEAADKLKPSTIAHYLINLCQHFNEFYHRRRVIDDEREELTKARILLCECTRQVVEIGLDVLGIQSPDEM